MRRWPAIVALVMLAGTWGLLLSLSQAEPLITRKSFAEFPLTIGDQWLGKELGMQQNVLDVLKLSDYMMRVYIPRKGIKDADKSGQGTTPIYLYVGYYQSQRTGATYHSPKNCLPGGGWQFMDSQQVPIVLANGEVANINKVLIQKGLEKQVILYWYQDRGRIIASEYWAKGFLVWDSMTKKRTDGSLVRISVPVKDSEESAYAMGFEFMREIFPLLGQYLPT
ncbi:MAG: exosortase C-terminal domain/associated protein EpsI [Nitrospirota bacterium]